MPDLIYVAAVVFALMCAGLISTGMEFKKLQEAESQKGKE